MAEAYAVHGLRILYLLVLLPFYSHSLGAAGYGLVLAATSIFVMVWQIVEFGFPAIGTRQTARASGARDISAVYRRQMSGRAAMVLPALLVGVAACWTSPLLRAHPMVGMLAAAAGILMAFNSGWHFSATLRFRITSLLELLGLGVILAIVLGFVRGPDDVWIVALALLTSGALSSGLGYALASRHLVPTSAVTWREAVDLVRESTPVFIHTGLLALVAASSTFIVSLYAMPEQVGWYGIAERVFALGMTFLLPLKQVAEVVISRHAAAGPRRLEQAYAVMRVAFLVVTGYGTLVWLGALAFADPVVPMLLGRSFEPVVPLLLILCMALPFAAFSFAVSDLVLIPLARDRNVARITVFASLLSASLMLLAAATLGVTGVAYARAAGVVCLALGLGWASHREGLLLQLWRPRRHKR